MATHHQLHLVVPGLLGPLPGGGTLPASDVPALARLLARGHRQPCPGAGLEELLFELFGVQAGTGDRPVAAVTHLAEYGAAPGWWLRADPVHLRADRTRLVLFDSRPLAIEPDETIALIDAVNAFYADAGWRLEATATTRWYLHLDAPAAITTRPLPAVVGADVDPNLPAGGDARQWHTVLNEIQMLFHAHPVNRTREERGRPLVNSVWFWGGGELPLVPPGGWDGVWADEPLARGLAALAGVPSAARPVDGAAFLSAAPTGRHLVVLDELRDAVAYGDAGEWRDGIAGLERDWFAPLLAALHDGRLQELVLLPAAGQCWRARRAGLLRFWRRAGPVTAAAVR